MTLTSNDRISNIYHDTLCNLPVFIYLPICFIFISSSRTHRVSQGSIHQNKNNIRPQGLKEGVEGENLVSYLEELFLACLGTNSDTKVRLNKAYRLGPI